MVAMDAANASERVVRRWRRVDPTSSSVSGWKENE